MLAGNSHFEEQKHADFSYGADVGAKFTWAEPHLG